MVQPLVRMGKVTEVGMRTGMAFTILSFGALAGPPISGAIFDRTGKFENVGYYAGGSLFCAHSSCVRKLTTCGTGSAVMSSVVLMIIARRLLLGKLFGHA